MAEPAEADDDALAERLLAVGARLVLGGHLLEDGEAR